MALIIRKLTCTLNIGEEMQGPEKQEMVPITQRLQSEMLGQHLDVTAQQKFENLMGYDLGNVMIFTNPTVDQLLDSMSADAAALGSDVFVKQSKFNPSTNEGEALLAHELTHVAQYLRGQTGADQEQEALQTEHQVRQGKMNKMVGSGAIAAATGQNSYSQEKPIQAAATDRTYWPKEQTQSRKGVCIRWPNGQVDQVSQQTLNQAYALAARRIKDKRNEFEQYLL